MTAVQHRARLHEASVQAIARGDVKRTRRRDPQRRRVLDARYTKVDPLIWRMVRDNGIDHLRVEVLGDRDVIIWNTRQPWPSSSTT